MCVVIKKINMSWQVVGRNYFLAFVHYAEKKVASVNHISKNINEQRLIDSMPISLNHFEI